jgi:hypothetical protein
MLQPDAWMLTNGHIVAKCDTAAEVWLLPRVHAHASLRTFCLSLDNQASAIRTTGGIGCDMYIVSELKQHDLGVLWKLCRTTSTVMKVTVFSS